MRRPLNLLRSLGEGSLRLESATGPEGPRLVEAGPARLQAPAARLLIVDDDEADAGTRRRMFAGQGYDLVEVSDLDAARRLWSGGDFDLVILEPDMREGDGWAFCRDIAASRAAILIHSRCNQAIDRVAGLEFGADDYLDKGCHPIEFLARVRALLRRADCASRRASAAPNRYRFAGWRFDADCGELVSPAGQGAWLGPSERSLLTLFVSRPRQVLSRRDIKEALFGSSGPEGIRVVDVRVVRLRRTLDACCEGGGDLIRTVRGGGYLLSAAVAPA